MYIWLLQHSRNSEESLRKMFIVNFQDLRSALNFGVENKWYSPCTLITKNVRIKNRRKLVELVQTDYPNGVNQKPTQYRIAITHMV